MLPFITKVVLLGTATTLAERSVVEQTTMLFKAGNGALTGIGRNGAEGSVIVPVPATKPPTPAV